MTNDSQIDYKTDQSSVPSDQENKAIKKVWKPLIFRLLLYIIKNIMIHERNSLKATWTFILMMINITMTIYHKCYQV